MKIAYSTNAYTRWPLARAVEDIRELGFDGVELLADVPHLADIPHVSGFPVSNLNGNTVNGEFRPSLIEPDPKLRRERVEYTKRVIDFAKHIGADCVCTSSGFLPDGVKKAQAREWFVQSLELILVHAERAKVRVGIEYEPGFLVGDRKALSPILEEIDHPLLGVNLDLGHAVCVGERPEESIEHFAGRIWNLHIEDIAGRVHEHLIPGKGTIRFEPIRAALDHVRYDRFLTLEIYPYKDRPTEAGRESLAVLRKFFG